MMRIFLFLFLKKLFTVNKFFNFQLQYLFLIEIEVYLEFCGIKSKKFPVIEKSQKIVLFYCNSKTNDCKYLKFSKYIDFFRNMKSCELFVWFFLVIGQKYDNLIKDSS